MDSFDDCIGLRVTSQYRFPFQAIVIFTHLGKFSHKFGTAIKHNSLWKWVTSEPSFLGDICDFCSFFIGYLCHLEPSCGRIDHCKTPHFKRVCSFPRDHLWTNEVYTQRVPRISFSLFRWQFAIFLISLFFSLACWAFITHVVDCCTKAFPVKI